MGEDQVIPGYQMERKDADLDLGDGPPECGRHLVTGVSDFAVSLHPPGLGLQAVTASTHLPVCFWW